MKTRHLALWTLLTGLAGTSMSQTTQSGFTYQGVLNLDGSPAWGAFELQSTLHDSAEGGGIVAGPITNSPVTASNGFFTVTLDFGSNPFDGSPIWLELAVRTNSADAFTTLAARQALTPAPYAIAAGTVTGTLPSSGLSGLYDNTVNFTDPDNLFTGAFTGDGGALTNVDASTLEGLAASQFWQLSGNTGTTPGTHFLGTTDNQPLRILAGGVGIGTANPAQALQIGDESIPDSQGMIRLASRSGTGNAHRAWDIGVPETDEELSGIGYSFIIDDTLLGSTPEFMIRRGNGHVGIGTLGPQRLLHVGDQNTPDSEGMIRLASRAGGTGTGYRVWDIGVPEDDDSLSGKYFSFIIDDLLQGTGPEFLIRWNTGNVGIGTTNPLAKLHVAGDLRTDGTITTAGFAGDGSGLTNVDAATLGGVSAGQFWQLGGNGGTTAGTDFLGTTDDEALELKVNNLRALRLEPVTASTFESNLVNVLAGSPANRVAAFVRGATIGGGGVGYSYGASYSNRVEADFGTISGGLGNLIRDQAGHATIAGGYENTIGQNVWNGTISGGSQNIIEDEANGSLIGGGQGNRIQEGAEYVTLSGGLSNLTEVVADYASIGGGRSNKCIGVFPTIPGGDGNQAYSYSFAAGRHALAVYDGCFVWADSQNLPFAATTPDQVSFRCQGGVRFTSGSGAANQTVSWTPGSASWSFSSDRNLKEFITPLDAAAVLDKVTRLPISEWNYQGYSQRHIGPMAQDFHALFPLNDSDTTLNSADLHGVALAAIQGLNEKVDGRMQNAESKSRLLEERLQQKETEIARLKHELGELKALVNAMNRKLNGGAR
jgi:hypothetical protein